jgi:hypothetical protein
MYGEGLWNPASSQAQIATEFPAPVLTIIPIYTAETWDNRFPGNLNPPIIA